MRKKVIANAREAIMAGLMELAASDPAWVLVGSDSLKALRATEFAEKYPERTFDVGIAEQNAVGFAAGLAAAGLKPIMGTYAGFISMRACEQVRTFVGYTGLGVKFIGLNGGIAGGEREGVTHQFFEDIGILRSIPGIEIVVPADASQARKAILALCARKGPAYIRIGSGREPAVLDESMDFQFGKARVLEKRGSTAAIFACGPILKRVLTAAKLLAAEGIGVTVVEVHTLKPLDLETIVSVLTDTRAAVTVEDHNIIGGLGSAISEASVENLPVPLERIGLRDVYPESGEPEELLDRFKMAVSDICAAVKKVIKRKEAEG